MPTKAQQIKAGIPVVDLRTGAFNIHGIRFFNDYFERIGGQVAPSNSELQGSVSTAQATADAAQADATQGLADAASAQASADAAVSVAAAAAVAATNAQDDANTAQSTADDAIAQLAVPANQIPYGTGTEITSEAAFTYDPTTNTLTVEKIKGKLISQFGDGVVVADNGAATVLGFYAATPVIQPTTAGAGATFVAGAGTAVNDASTFDGYTIKQVVKALRDLGLLA